MDRKNVTEKVTFKLRPKWDRAEGAFQVVKSDYVRALKHRATAWCVRGTVKSPAWWQPMNHRENDMK